MHHWAEVEFEEEAPAGEQEKGASPPKKFIRLEITAPSEKEAKIWDCFAVTSPKVGIRTNAITLKYTKL